MSQTIQLDPVAALMLAIIVALWVAAAVAAIVMGLRRDAVAKARSRDVERQASQSALESSPPSPTQCARRAPLAQVLKDYYATRASPLGARRRL
jgi:hypothetical protein